MRKWWKDRKRFLIVAGTGLALFGLGVLAMTQPGLPTGGRVSQATIVVDAGHGGIDPGKVGINGAYEKDINLSIAKYLRDILQKKKCQVIMTREEDRGLYEETDQNKKTTDLRKRVEMMNQEQVDFVISIHQNSYSGENSKGAQVFFQSSSVEGETLAKIIQAQMISSLGTWNHRQAKANNSYYLLKKTAKPTVIVECGFLSNEDEARKLCDKTYQRQVAWAIAQGALTYLDSGGENPAGGSDENRDHTD